MTSIKTLGLLALGLFVSSASLSAQELGKIRYRAEIGGTASKITALGVGFNGDKGKQLINLRAGGSIVMPFENTIFSFNPGLYLIGRGEKQANLKDSQKGLYTVTNYALQIPLELSFRLATIEEKHRIFLNVDPYVAYGLSAKRTGNDEGSIDLYKNGKFKRFDFGIGANLMYQYKRAYLRGGIEASVLKQVDGTNYNLVNIGTARYITSYITVGYEF